MNYQELCQSWGLRLHSKYNSAEVINIFNYLKHYLQYNKFNFESLSLKNELDKKLKCLEAGEPVQYVFGSTPFLNLEIQVDERVLIPRSETEEWVEKLIKSISGQASLKILDIGTGSGCIAIAIKKKRPYCQLSAIDVSKDAISLARENANTHSCKIEFLTLDFINDTFDPITPFDILVSNPPYISFSEKEKMSTSVLAFEPHVALFCPIDDALIFYRKIITFSSEHLIGEGQIFVELNEYLSEEIEHLFYESMMFSKIEIHSDLSNKPRMLHAVKK